MDAHLGDKDIADQLTIRPVADTLLELVEYQLIKVIDLIGIAKQQLDLLACSQRIR